MHPSAEREGGEECGREEGREERTEEGEGGKETKSQSGVCIHAPAVLQAVPQCVQ